MKTVQILQGTQEWHAFRREHFNASDAAAMLGISPYKTRAELLREYATGIPREITEAEQARFDRGHELEAAARAIAEGAIGQDLYPAVGESDGWGKLSASFDGIIINEEIIWEHKTLNQEYLDLADGQSCIEPENLPGHVMAQIQQQLLVSGAGQCVFSASDEAGYVTASVLPSGYWRDRLLAGWRQFEKDLENWQPEPAPDVVPEGKSPELLPILRVEASGRIVSSNIAQFQARALEIIGAINTRLVTDEDFSDAEKSVKWCKGAEESLSAAEAAIMAQTADIDEAVKTLRLLSGQIRAKRLVLEKSVKTEKEDRKNALVDEAVWCFREEVKRYQEKIDGFGLSVLLRWELPDFGKAIKGLKTLDSLKNALVAETLKVNAEIKARATVILANLETLKGFDASYAFLWRGDLNKLAEMPNEAFVATIKGRVAEHKAAEEKRLEAERERIRKEEEARLAAERAKLEKEAEAKAEAERERIRREEESAAIATLLCSVASAKAEAGAAARIEEEGIASSANADAQLDAEAREIAFKGLPTMDYTAVRAFLKTRDFGKDEPHIRAALVEFLKFCRERQVQCERKAA